MNIFEKDFNFEIKNPNNIEECVKFGINIIELFKIKVKIKDKEEQKKLFLMLFRIYLEKQLQNFRIWNEWFELCSKIKIDTHGKSFRDIIDESYKSD